MRKRVCVLLCVVLWGASGCGDELKDAGDKVKDGGREARDKLAEKIEAELVDFLECEKNVRPSTIQRIKTLLRDPEALTLKDLVSAPEDVAQIIGMAGLTVEGYVILLRNLELLFSQGHASQLLTQGVGSLNCEETLTLACTAGTGTTKVLCPVNQPRQIESSFAGCFLSGRKHDGQMRFTLPPGEGTNVKVEFDRLVLDEVTRVVGDVTLQLGASSSAQSFSFEAMQGLEFISHGGPTSGRSCGELLRLERMAFLNQPERLQVGFKGNKQTPKESYAIETFGPSDLNWSKPIDCPCPQPGAGMRITVPKPLGRADQTATMQVTYAAGDGATCAVARVEMLGWPTECSFLENPRSDCGKKAAEEVVAPLLSAMCLR
jgi:hypothetical protein